MPGEGEGPPPPFARACPALQPCVLKDPDFTCSVRGEACLHSLGLESHLPEGCRWLQGLGVSVVWDDDKPGAARRVPGSWSLSGQDGDRLRRMVEL